MHQLQHRILHSVMMQGLHADDGKWTSQNLGICQLIPHTPDHHSPTHRTFPTTEHPTDRLHSVPLTLATRPL